MKHHTISLVFVVSLLGAGVAVGVGVDTGSAQPTEEFNVTFGGSDTGLANSVIETSDGGFALAAGTFVEKPDGLKRFDAWLIKTDENGNEQINKTFGGGDDDRASSVIETSDGGLALAGYTESFGSGDDLDTLLIKTDANGNVAINKTFDNPLLSTDDRASSVVETSDGGFALAGQTEVGVGRGDVDARLIKTDANGNLEFSQTFGGLSAEDADSVVETSDGGFALAGYTESFGAGSRDAWLIKTDENGNEQFNKTFGGGLRDDANSLVETPDGGLALAGYTESFGSGGSDAWLIKTDENGNEQFNKTYSRSGSSGPAQSVVRTSDGGLALAASTVVEGDIDAWLIKTDANGNEQFNKTFGGGLRDEANSVVETSDGGFALAGSTQSFGAGFDSAWLIKFSGSGGTTSPVEGVSDELWTAVTQDDGNDGLSLADLGNAIQEYQKNPSDADVDGVSIGLSDLGSLIQYYQNEVV